MTQCSIKNNVPYWNTNNLTPTLGSSLWLTSDYDTLSWNDKSGNNNNATSYGVVNRILLEPSRVLGSPIRLTSTSGYMSIPRNISLEPAIISVETWIKGSGTATWRYIISKRMTTGSASYSIHTDATQGLKFTVYNGASEVGSPIIPPSMIWNGLWHHVVGMYNPSNNQSSIYLDGSQYGTPYPYYTVGTGINYNTLTNLLIGRFNETYTTIDADISELRIYNRLLTPTEIGYNYNHSVTYYVRG